MGTPPLRTPPSEFCKADPSSSTAPHAHTSPHPPHLTTRAPRFPPHSKTRASLEATEAAAERGATADAAAASRAQERSDAALEKRRAEFKRLVEKAKKRFDDVAQVWARRDRRTNDRLRDMRVLPAKAAAA